MVLLIMVLFTKKALVPHYCRWVGLSLGLMASIIARLLLEEAPIRDSHIAKVSILNCCLRIGLGFILQAINNIGDIVGMGVRDRLVLARDSSPKSIVMQMEFLILQITVR